jgi:hypothetical protein
MNKIIARIERELGIPDLATLLAEKLAATDLQSLLLEVYRLRSQKRRPADVLTSYAADRFVQPAAIIPQRLLAWDQIAMSLLPAGFQALELSPVCPLGTSAVIAGLSQDWAVATARNTEVVSDATNVLALECALRRRGLLQTNPKSTEPVHLAANHRLLRAQKYEGVGRQPHFRLLSLCSAGRNVGSESFEVSALVLQIQFYIKALRAFRGPEVRLRLAVTDFSGEKEAAWMEEQLLSPFRDEHVEAVIDGSRTSGKGYYPGLCFHMYTVNAAGNALELADGGGVDWIHKLLGSAKERLVISGIAGERVCSLPENGWL